MFPLLTKPTCLDGVTFTVRFTVVLDCLLSKGDEGTDPEFEVCEWSLDWFHTGESLDNNIQKDAFYLCHLVDGKQGRLPCS